MTWEYKRKGRWYIRKGLLKTRRKPRKRSFAVLRDNNNHQILGYTHVGENVGEEKNVGEKKTTWREKTDVGENQILLVRKN